MLNLVHTVDPSPHTCKESFLVFAFCFSLLQNGIHTKPSTFPTCLRCFGFIISSWTRTLRLQMSIQIAASILSTCSYIFLVPSTRIPRVFCTHWMCRWIHTLIAFLFSSRSFSLHLSPEFLVTFSLFYGWIGWIPGGTKWCCRRTVLIF